MGPSADYIPRLTDDQSALLDPHILETFLILSHSPKASAKPPLTQTQSWILLLRALPRESVPKDISLLILDTLKLLDNEDDILHTSLFQKSLSSIFDNPYWFQDYALARRALSFYSGRDIAYLIHRNAYLFKDSPPEVLILLASMAMTRLSPMNPEDQEGLSQTIHEFFTACPRALEADIPKSILALLLSSKKKQVRLAGAAWMKKPLSPSQNR